MKKTLLIILSSVFVFPILKSEVKSDYDNNSHCMSSDYYSFTEVGLENNHDYQFSVKQNNRKNDSESALQIKSVEALLSRLLPKNHRSFVFGIISKSDSNNDVFEISSTGRKILVKGSSASAMASGVSYYLNNYCKASFSWTGDQNNLPKQLPQIQGVIRKVTPYQYRYSFNYCTHNYTMSFWDWKRWEREIDLMAMQGVNVFLSPVGSEAVWQKTLEKFGYTFSEIQDFIAGPAYTAWWLMANLEGEGGKVSQSYINNRTALQKKNNCQG